MNPLKKYTEYTDFLSDEDFIQWILLNDESLGNKWNQYIKENPDLEGEFSKAIDFARKIKLNDDRLDDRDFILLHGRIKNSYQKLNRKRTIKQITGYVAAACVAVTVLSGIYFAFIKNTGDFTQSFTDNMIVGQNLESEDIALITNSSKTTYTKDINLEITDNGALQVKEAEGGKSTVIATEKETMNKLIVPYGKRSVIDLADGTKVWVNSGSVLEFPSTFTGSKREINLSGEIYIEVAKDKKPFYVNTSQLQIKVYGTRFNVSSYADNSPTSIVLVDGRVSVKAGNEAENFLEPNDMLTYANNLFIRKQVEVSRYTSWKDGYLILDKTPITEVLEQIGRYYNLTFNLGNNINLQSRTCDGKIYLSPNLDNVMTTISLLSSTEYKRNENTIYINLKEN